MSRPHTVLRTRRELRRVLAASKPDAIICHSSWIAGLAAPVAREAGLPVATWIHDRLSGRTWAERWASLARIWPSLLLIFIVLFARDGIMGGLRRLAAAASAAWTPWVAASRAETARWSACCA